MKQTNEPSTPPTNCTMHGAFTFSGDNGLVFCSNCGNPMDSTPSTERVSTPLMELIEYLEKYKEVIGMTAVMTIDKAKSLLPKERQDLINAYDAGKEQPSNSQLCPAEYFTQTFKQ